MKISAQNKIVRILLIFIVPLIILLGTYNWYVLDMINKQSVQYGKSMLDIYSQPLESELNIVENYFDNIIWYDRDFRKLVYAKTERKAHARLEDVNTKIQTIYSTALNMAGHIIYHTDTDQAKEYYHSSYSYATKKQFMSFMKENYEKFIPAQTEEWIHYKVENNAYLIRFFALKGTVLMGIYDLNKVDVPQMYEENELDDFIFIADERKKIITHIEQAEKMGFELDSGSEESYVSWDSEQKYLVVEKKLNALDLYMIYATPYYGWIAVDIMPLFFLCFSAFVGVLLGVCIILIHKSYIVPLRNMVDTMITIKMGDMGNRMEDDYQISEFSVATKTFNEMLDRIQELKIASYEQKLETQRATMRYLQIQIRPHFILNCLKNVFSLAQEERYREIQETVIVLSQYMRYVLKDDLMLVSVNEELISVENYIFLQKMSASDCIKCEYMVEEDALSCMLPPLSILTFVENSVKHGQQTGKKFVISIKVNVIADFLNITILDNGSGFSREDLEFLNHKKDFSYGNEHIGIQNVLHRFFIIYHGKSEIIFSNTGGACVEIFIPLEKTRRNEDGCADC